jgi:uncharacterized protein YhfF
MRATAWILDLTHRVRRFACDVPAGVRPLAAVKDAMPPELRATTDDPIGVRALDSAPALLFLAPQAGQGGDWQSLPDFALADEAGFALYVDAMLGGWAPPTHALDVFYFGHTPALAAKLAHLVVKGVKRGTTGWVAAQEREGSAIPEAGLVSIVTDGFGYAQCAIRSEQVEHLRFGDVGERHAWVEGEGDRTLACWREAHLAYFHDEGARVGLTFSEDAVVFFEHFVVLEVFGRSDEMR